eukprot:5724666-Amphidinium_carterae.1
MRLDVTANLGACAKPQTAQRRNKRISKNHIHTNLPTLIHPASLMTLQHYAERPDPVLVQVLAISGGRARCSCPSSLAMVSLWPCCSNAIPIKLQSLAT